MQLAALSLSRRPLTEEQIDDFSGTDRYVADYFKQELLGRLPESTVEFLTRISVLDRFSGPQCDALLGRLGAARALDALEDSCTFMVALDRHRRVYRFHRLFRDLLRAELDRREPGLAPTLHSRAANWYEAHGAPTSLSTTGSTRASSTARRSSSSGSRSAPSTAAASRSSSTGSPASRAPRARARRGAGRPACLRRGHAGPVDQSRAVARGGGCLVPGPCARRDHFGLALAPAAPLRDVPRGGP